MPRTTPSMCLILRWMPDAFQRGKLVATVAVLFAVAAAVGFVLGSQQGGEKPPATVAGPAETVPKPPTTATTTCKLDLGALSVSGCKLLKSDTGSARDPNAL